MPNDQYQYESIGVIRTPFESPEGMPIQPAGADTVEGTVEVTESYADGLQDLSGFSHCILLYHFHAAADTAPLQVEPFLDAEQRGIFATRAPQRPNQIGLSVVEVDSITGPEVTVRGIDVVDGTPLLDIKPFVPDFDVPDDVDIGWLNASKSTIESKQADKRFL
jgi:tRNA-Thr(GGU) m(6)t(6)A37 methyltransferase TsaA